MMIASLQIRFLNCKFIYVVGVSVIRNDVGGTSEMVNVTEILSVVVLMKP